MRVVIDTNLLIDGAKDDFNYGNRIIDEVIAGRIKAFANHATLRENSLLAAKKISDQQYLQKLSKFFEAVQNVELSKKLDVVEDKEDNKLIESAVAAQADYLISADRHLLKLGNYGKIQIVTPQEFWNRYEDETGTGWQKWINQFIK